MPNLEAHPTDSRTDKESSHLWITPGCFRREMNCKLENMFQWFESPFADIRRFHGLSMASSNQNLAPNDEDSKTETQKGGSGPVQIDLQTLLIHAGEMAKAVKELPRKHEDLSLVPQSPCENCQEWGTPVIPGIFHHLPTHPKSACAAG